MVRALGGSCACCCGGFSSLRLLLLLLLLTVAWAEADGGVGGKAGKDGGENHPGNFMEDEQWLASISQYSGKIKHWNRFRDVSGQLAGGGSQQQQ